MVVNLIRLHVRAIYDRLSEMEYEVKQDKIYHTVTNIRYVFINAELKSDIIKAQSKIISMFNFKTILLLFNV